MAENERFPRPSEIYEKFREINPVADEADFRGVIIRSVRETAEKEGRKPTISDYKEYLQSTEKMIDEHPEIVNFAVETGTYYQKLEALISPSVLPKFNAEIEKLLPSDITKVVIYQTLDRFTPDDNVSAEENMFRMVELVQARLATIVLEAFKNPEISGLFEDDPVLLKKLKEHYLTITKDLASKLFAASYEEITEEDIEDSDNF